MRKITSAVFLLYLPLFLLAQKKPLDHTVYDVWQSIGERAITNNGKYVAYVINPQEGDGVLVVQSADSSYKKEIPRGYTITLTEDSRFLICKIKPLFKDTRDAKIKKKKADEMPKDSLAILQLGTDSLIKKPGVKNYKTPAKAAGWVAYLFDKGFGENTKPRSAPDSLSRLNNIAAIADSLAHVADSLRNKVAEAKNNGMAVLQATKKDVKKVVAEPFEEGGRLVLLNLATREETIFPLVSDYVFSKGAEKLLVETTKRNNDSITKATVLLVSLPGKKIDTVMKGFNDAKNYAFDEAATQLAFVAERDSSVKALQKYYKLWYYKPGMDSAQLRGDRNTAGVTKGLTISENYQLNFSHSGKRLFIGLAPVRPVKDTTIPDFEKAGLDVWNYKDDDLQPVQLKNLDRELRRSYLAMLTDGSDKIVQLGSEVYRTVFTPGQGDAGIFYTSTDTGRRVARQWQGYTFNDVYSINPETAAKSLIAKDFKGTIDTSTTGKYLLMYDDRKRGYWVYNSTTKQLYKIGADIKYPLYDEENDVPDDPAPYGIAEWEKNDKYIYIYDRYDIWKVDPEGKEKSITVAGFSSRAGKISYRFMKTGLDERYIDTAQYSYFRYYNEENKSGGFITAKISSFQASLNVIAAEGGFSYNSFLKADSADVYLYTKENFEASPNIYVTSNSIDSIFYAERKLHNKINMSFSLQAIQLSHINPQQSQYLWGSAELFKWKAYTGKETEGVLYKPENFDPKKKYPMIVYYYERNNNTLLNYQAPAPTPSRLNIPFFVSNGYVVFVPDIWYTTGHPGKSAYDYVVSGTRALIKQGFIDSSKIGLQGQSWGGYQTAYLITQTNLYAAAWAGAPVVNMFSAYGGIRWESGLDRQFQYEKTQSRIGATIWERPNLYIENSPLFHLQKVKTPLVIMSNDADGAVPWYQGIEFFTAMRRLNKPVWMLTYNGEAHNLAERRNRKDIQIREQQFFDWLLKGQKPPVWITDGVPAALKGIDAGLEIK